MSAIPGTRAPVLLLAFNRPDSTQRILEAVAAANVPRIYVSVDGARPDRPAEAERCQRVLDVVASRRWADEVLVRRSDRNLGCKYGVTAGIDWFFSHEQEGVVVEDDCLPGPDFLLFCDRMLSRYRDDGRVWQVSGSNLLGSWRPRGNDHFFGDGGIWGWASWARAWRERDMAMETWHDIEARRRAKRFLGIVGWHHMAPRYAAVAAGEIDTWDYQWSWTRASHEGLSVIPSRNLVTNIGFGSDATHTVQRTWFAAMPARPLRVTSTQPAVRFDRGYQTALAVRLEGLAWLRSLAARAGRRVFGTAAWERLRGAERRSAG